MDISLENRINPLNNNNFIEFKDTESHKDF